ncbi:MAG: helix-turn-helix transcriptional regulator [Spiribacter salinus]|uniref:Helix-turn-helix transcriptional regulator n=1 Tax=Spiribacter salinus TaxID=1335746 RepID=A0A540V7J1_9GAMM|nr:MAG: helix-turn-helix transcriptional regulator [Spiribacter salinus]
MDEVDYVRIGGWVREQRDLRGMNRYDLSDLSGCSVATIRRIETGDAGCALSRVTAVVNALGGRLRAEDVT